jgi:hypothetical protein
MPADLPTYLRQLDQELRRYFVRDAALLEEARAHLEDAVERGVGEGLDPEEARARAIARFGSPVVVARSCAADRFRGLHRWLFLAAAALGFAIAYVDALPTWDDTGVTAGMLLLAAALLGLLGPRRAWLWALLIGGWIPVHAMMRAPGAGALAMLVVLLFPLTGACLGVLQRRWTTG